MSQMAELDTYVKRAYDKALKTLLWSETGGCTDDCYLWGETDRCGEPRCDRAYDTHGWGPWDIDPSHELLCALQEFTEEYWTAINWMKMSPEELGYNFVLTVNEHGDGFWGSPYEPCIMKAMTEDSQKYAMGGIHIHEHSDYLSLEM